MLRKRKFSYSEVSKKLGVTKDQVKYVGMTSKIYKNAYNIFFNNSKNYTFTKQLIKEYDKQGLKYKEIAEKLNKKVHELGILPFNINITRDMILKWRRKIGLKNKFSIIKKNSNIWKNIIKLVKLRKYTYQEIAQMFGVTRSQVESIAYRQNIRQTVFNTLILNPNAWNYFKTKAEDLFKNDVKYKNMARILNKELHSKSFIPKEIRLTKDCLRHILRNKLNLPIRQTSTKKHSLKTYTNFVKLILKNKQVISKNKLDKLMYKEFNLKKGACEQIYMKLRWNKTIASSIKRPLCYILVNWKNIKYKIKKYKNKNFIWFTGKGRFTNSDLIKLLLIEKNHPLTFGQIIREFKKRFNLNITGNDLGIIIGNERKRANKSKTKPKVDIITHPLDSNLLFLYIVPEKVTVNKITSDIKKDLIKNYKKDIKLHLKGCVEGKELDKCLKNIACNLWNFKKDFVLPNKKRPDLLNKNKIIEIKKVIDTKTLTSINQKYGKYAKIIEVWYLYKKPLTLINKKSNIILKPISKLLNEIDENNLPQNIIKDFKYIKNKFIK